jgi:hypothetical protein
MSRGWSSLAAPELPGEGGSRIRNVTFSKMQNLKNPQKIRNVTLLRFASPAGGRKKIPWDTGNASAMIRGQRHPIRADPRPSAVIRGDPRLI